MNYIKKEHIKIHTNTMDITGKKFGKLIVIGMVGMKDGRSQWNCKCDCGNVKIISGKQLGNGNAVSCGCNRSLLKMGKLNPIWAGDSVGYSALHQWVKKRLKPTIFCEQCHIRKPYDLANRSGLYKRDLGDWEWLCRKCHMEGDGRLKELRKNSLEWSKNRDHGWCTIDGCHNKLHGKGLCHKHYEAKRRREEIDYINDKYGPVCVCGKRHIFISSPGHNLPKSSDNKCDEKN